MRAPAAETDGPWKVETATSLEQIEHISATWKAMECHPNSHLEFYCAVVRARPEVIHPYVMTLVQGDIASTMWVARLEEIAVPLRVGYKTMLSPRCRVLTLVHGGYLGQDSTTGNRLLLEHVHQCLGRGLADAAYFSAVPVATDLYRQLRSSNSALFRDRAPTIHPHFQTELPSVSRRLSNGTRWQIRKLQQAHKHLRVRVLSTADELPLLYSYAEQVSSVAFQRALGVGFVPDAETHQVLQITASENRLRAYFLLDGERPVSFWIGNLWQGSFYLDYTAYDPIYSRYSPGTFLFTYLMSDLRRDGVSHIDFGSGDAPYKRRFATHQWQEASVFMFASRAKGCWLSVAHHATAALSHAATRALTSVSLLQRVKTSWRSRLRSQGAVRDNGVEKCNS